MKTNNRNYPIDYQFLLNILISITAVVLSVLTVITNIILDIKWISLMVAFLLALFVLLQIATLDFKTMWGAFTLTSLSLLLLFAQQNNVSGFIEAWNTNTVVIAVLVFSPLLAVPIRIGAYGDSLKRKFHRIIYQQSKIFPSIAVVTFGLSSFINLGSIALISELIEKWNLEKVALATMMNRGYALAALCSPYFAISALILTQTGINWADIAVYAFIFAAICLCYIYVQVAYKYKKEVEKIPLPIADEILPKDDRKFRRLLGMMAILLGLIYVGDQFIPVPTFAIVCIVAFSFPLLWGATGAKLSFVLSEYKRHLFETVPRIKKELFLILAAGAFGYAISGTAVVNEGILVFYRLANVSIYAVSILILVLMLSVTLAGLHPILIFTIIVTVMTPAELGMNAEYFTILIIGGFALSNLFSPSTASNNLIKLFMQLNIKEFTIKQNVGLGLFIIFVLPLFLVMIL